MSLELTAIKKRLEDLKGFRAKGLAVTNATEMYVNDVEDLLKVVDAMRETVAQFGAKMREQAGQERVPPEFFYQMQDRAITRLLNGNFKGEGGAPRSPKLSVIDPNAPPAA